MIWEALSQVLATQIMDILRSLLEMQEPWGPAPEYWSKSVSQDPQVSRIYSKL